MLNWILGIALSGAVVTAGYYVREYDKRGSEITSLKYEVSKRDNTILVFESNQKLDRSTIDSLGARLGERLGELEANCAVLEDIKKEVAADPTAKEEVGGVVGTVLERLRLRKKD